MPKAKRFSWRAIAWAKKPLYYRATAAQLIFGSEVKALLMHPGCPRELDARNLSKYLAYEYVPSPHCIFKGIHKLPAGHWLTWKNGQARVRRYWDLQFSGRQQQAVLKTKSPRNWERVSRKRCACG